jgi:hypothetical protein
MNRKCLLLTKYTENTGPSNKTSIWCGLTTDFVICSKLCLPSGLHLIHCYLINCFFSLLSFNLSLQSNIILHCLQSTILLTCLYSQISFYIVYSLLSFNLSLQSNIILHCLQSTILLTCLYSQISFYIVYSLLSFNLSLQSNIILHCLQSTIL